MDGGITVYYKSNIMDFPYSCHQIVDFLSLVLYIFKENFFMDKSEEKNLFFYFLFFHIKFYNKRNSFHEGKKTDSSRVDVWAKYDKLKTNKPHHQVQHHQELSQIEQHNN